MDALSNQNGTQMHIATFTFQAIASGIASFQGKRSFFYTSSGNVPCTLPLVDNKFCPFKAGGFNFSMLLQNIVPPSQNTRRGDTLLAPFAFSAARRKHVLSSQDIAAKLAPLDIKAHEFDAFLQKKATKSARSFDKIQLPSILHSMQFERLHNLLVAHKQKRRLLQVVPPPPPFLPTSPSVSFTMPRRDNCLALVYKDLGGTLGDVNQDEEFNVLDALMGQEYHLIPSTSILMNGMTRSQLSRRHLQHLFPIGSNTSQREFQHLLYALGGKQPFVSNVTFEAAQDTFQLRVKLDSFVPAKVTFVIQTWQWWMFHTLLGQTSMFYDEDNKLLFVEAMQAMDNWFEVQAVPYPKQLPPFPLSVQYKLGWHHALNYVPEGNVRIAFLVETDPATDPQRVASYIQVFPNAGIAQAYAMANLTSTSVCYAYASNNSSSSSSSSAAVPLPVSSTVVINNTFDSVAGMYQEFYEGKLHVTVQMSLSSKENEQNASLYVLSISVQQLNAMLHWDTWLYLPFQCVYAAAGTVVRLPTTKPPVLLNVRNDASGEYKVNVSLEVGMRRDTLDAVRDLLVDVEQNKLEEIASKMEFGFDTLFGDVLNVDSHSIELFITGRNITRHVPPASSPNNNVVRPVGSVGNNKYIQNATFLPLPETSPSFSKASRKVVPIAWNLLLPVTILSFFMSFPKLS